MRFRPNHLARVVAAAIIGISYPHAELAWKCRPASATSEACVWGRAYMPLSLWVEPLIIFPFVFLLLSLVTYLLSRGRGHGNSTPNKEL